MANVLHRTTKQYLTSQNTAAFPTIDWIINPDLSGLVETQPKYWNISGDIVTDMNNGEKNVVDSNAQNAKDLDERIDAKAEFDDQKMHRAMMSVVLDLYNAGKKNGAPNVSLSQIRTRIRDKLDIT